ncbi:uncharacterized protein J3R85_007949 [Psidium guajava]|nr:uncharacterized protein J3R85_007949 [Psidium guajava]
MSWRRQHEHTKVNIHGGARDDAAVTDLSDCRWRCSMFLLYANSGVDGSQTHITALKSLTSPSLSLSPPSVLAFATTEHLEMECFRPRRPLPVHRLCMPIPCKNTTSMIATLALVT